MIRRVLIVGFPVLLLLACSIAPGHYQISLPNGYFFVYDPGGNFIYQPPTEERNRQFSEKLDKGEDPGPSQISTKIGVIDYAVIGDVVTGRIVIDEHLTKKYPSDSLGKHGYFVLETKTGELHDGLNEAEWDEVLKASGITSPPVLRKPSYSDAQKRGR